MYKIAKDNSLLYAFCSRFRDMAKEHKMSVECSQEPDIIQLVAEDYKLSTEQRILLTERQTNREPLINQKWSFSGLETVLFRTANCQLSTVIQQNRMNNMKYQAR